MLEKILQAVSNLKVLKKINEIIDSLNTHMNNMNNPHNVTAEQLGLATAYIYKGSVTNFSDLPTNAQNGWVYSVENEHTDSSGIIHPAGANFAWNGTSWDDLGGSLSGYVKSVNTSSPDASGNVTLQAVTSLEKNEDDKLVVHNSDGNIQELEVGKKYTINGELPDENDNYTIKDYDGYWEANENVNVGDIRFLRGRNNTKYLLECIQAGITGGEQPEVEEPATLATFDNERVGSMRLIFNLAEKDDNELLALGVTYNRTVYSELWNYANGKTGLVISEEEWQLKYAQTGGNFVPYYSSGDGSTTFRTPLLKAYPKGSATDDVGNYLTDGLPNITRETGALSWESLGLTNGAFKTKEGTSTYSFDATPKAVVSPVLDASLSNPIYGNAEVVQPKTMCGIWVIKAIGTLIDTGNTNLSNVLTGIASVQEDITELQINKANKNALSMPSDNVINIAVTLTSPNTTSWVQQTIYTAPADGWFCIETKSGTADSRTATTLQVFNADLTIKLVDIRSVEAATTSLFSNKTLYVPVKAEDKVILLYINLELVQFAYFIYAQSEVE